ncbi:MAG: hypothetical protein K2X86_14595 [Cytophagaceae bacterium]|nr:hypothetical protein [Cytophagaceae bacterium]
MKEDNMTDMKNIKQLLIMATGLFFLLGSNKTFAQFDKKVSINASVGYVKPLSGKGKIDIEDNPYFFPNFRYGTQFNGAIQYNYTPKLSFLLNVGVTSMLGFKNPVTSNKDKSAFYIVGVGPEVKYHFLPSKKVNPYVLGEISINNYRGVQDAYDYTLNNPGEDYYYVSPSSGGAYVNMDEVRIRKSARRIESTFAMGVKVGGGLVFKLSESFAVFVQPSFSKIFTKGNEDLRIDTNFLTFEGGVKLSLFKSKSLL